MSPAAERKESLSCLSILHAPRLYGVIRHPSYLGLLVSMLGWALAFRAGVGVLLAVLTLVPVVARIRSEAKLLGMAFGDEYEAYRSRTSRLIPGLY